MDVTQLDTGIHNPLRDKVNEWLSNSLESQRQYHSRMEKKEDEIGYQFSLLMESSHLRRLSETMAQEFARSSLDTLQATIADLAGKGATSSESAVAMGDIRVWTMKVEGIQALVTECVEGGWVTLLGQTDDGRPEVKGVPWQRRPLLMEPGCLETMIREHGVKAAMEAVDGGGWNTDVYGSPDDVLVDAAANKIYHDKYAFSVKGRKLGGEPKVCTFHGSADPMRLADYLEVMGPLLSNHFTSSSPDEQTSLYADDLEDEAIALDGGRPGIICAALIRDMVALHRGQAMLEAVGGMHIACTALEGAGNTLGTRLVYNDMDERISMSRAEDGRSMAILYENVSYCGHPREFLLVARWPEGVQDETSIPAVLEVYPVFPNSGDDDNMTAEDMEAEGDDAAEIAKQLAFEAGKNASMTANPPRLGVRDLVAAWREDRLTSPCAVLDTVAGTFRLDDPHDCTVAACWVVDTTLRWKAGGSKRNKDGYGRRDERFSENKPAAMHRP